MSQLADAIVEAGPDDEAGRMAWRMRSLSVRTRRGDWTTLRLVRFASGWLASADTLNGPTLGYDASPYLAAGRALAPLGIDLVAAMSSVGEVLAARRRVSRGRGPVPGPASRWR